MGQTSRCMLWLAVGVVLAGPSARADEGATPTPAPTATSAARPTPVVITNETLGTYAGRGHITEVATKTPTPGPATQSGKRDPSIPFRWEDDAGVAPAPPSGAYNGSHGGMKCGVAGPDCHRALRTADDSCSHAR
ncbi:MAG: hypothetical protein P8049_11025 [Gemmatimonadota bacterium]